MASMVLIKMLLLFQIWRGENVKKEMGVMAVYEEHNSYFQKLIGKDIKEVFWQKFENTKGHLKKFIHWKFMKREIKLSSLKFQFIKDFEYYLRTEENMQQSP